MISSQSLRKLRGSNCKATCTERFFILLMPCCWAENTSAGGGGGLEPARRPL